MPNRTGKLESIFNRINDWDGTWIGFRRYKPRANEYMGLRTVLVLCSVYAPILACSLGFTLAALGKCGLSLWLPAANGAVLFILFQSLSAYYWNRRAWRRRFEKQIEEMELQSSLSVE